MALLFLDSFDHYSTAQGSRKWTTWDGSVVTGRTGNGVSAAPFGPEKTLEGVEYAELTAGSAYKTTAFANQVHRFKNDLVGLRFDVVHVGDGRLRFFYVPPSTTGPNVSTFVMNLNEWYYVESRSNVTIANTGGNNGTITYESELWINGDSVLTETFPTNITNYSDYVPGGVNHCKWARVSLVGPGGFGAIHDDVYVTDGERLGDVKIMVLYPNAAGDLTQWTPTGAANNWDTANEHPADDDTTYVSSPTAGQQDLYNLDNIGAGFSGTIKGAQALWLVKKDDMGAGVTAGLWKSGVTTDQGEDFYPSATNYLYDRQAERKSLFTGLDWTESEINALQLGIKRIV